METEALVHAKSQPRVPDSRLPGAEVGEQKKTVSDGEEMSIYALWPVFFMIIVGATVAGFTFAYGPERALRLLLRCIMPDTPEPWHIVVMAAAIVACIIFCLPVLLIVFPLPSMIFGFWQGFVTLFLVQVIAATVSFFIGRYVAQRRVRGFLEGKQFRRTMRILQILEKDDESMQLLVLFRFLTIPMSARNYAPSVLSVPMPKLILSTIPHGLWSSMVFAVVGTALHKPARNLRDGHRLAFHAPQWQEILGIVVAVVSAALFTWIAYRAYTRKMEEEEDESMAASTHCLKSAEDGAESTSYGTSLAPSMHSSGS